MKNSAVEPEREPAIPLQQAGSRLISNNDTTKIDTSKQASSPSCCECLILLFLYPFTIIFFPILYSCLKLEVKEYERAIILRMGRLRGGGALRPGMHFLLPFVDTYFVLDMRTRTMDVPPQNLLTHDGVSVTVDAVVYYRVYDPIMATMNVENYALSTLLLASSTLRDLLGTNSLAEILNGREKYAQVMQAALDEATDPWGVKVERVVIKEISLPLELQRALAAESEARREANAKVIAAEGEMKASEALKGASEVLSRSPGALQLRYLQTLNTIAAVNNSTIIFPLPLDLVTPFIRGNK